ncbi:unnamed protein product [Protopolystoma xenopodis]|uniref:Uncharacterized protein n=1 Tax=Protopolystoma xenopodis TaxID=117903 RepID=A0A448XIP7_9PLAT|nr:unnamed protein product [Protopolystoma xenopodis]
MSTASLNFHFLVFCVAFQEMLWLVMAMNSAISDFLPCSLCYKLWSTPFS